MTLQVINVGTFNMDTTGDPLQLGFTKANENFVTLFQGTGLTPQLVNTSLTNNGQGDSCYVAFGKINANFAALFPIFDPSQSPLVINIGTQPYKGVIGLGDTGVLAWEKVNQNFALLNAPSVNAFDWTTENNAPWTTESGSIWTTQ